MKTKNRKKLIETADHEKEIALSGRKRGRVLKTELTGTVTVMLSVSLAPGKKEEGYRVFNSRSGSFISRENHCKYVSCCGGGSCYLICMIVLVISS